MTAFRLTEIPSHTTHFTVFVEDTAVGTVKAAYPYDGTGWEIAFNEIRRNRIARQLKAEGRTWRQTFSTPDEAAGFLARAAA
jgi:hypothetical protein